MTNSTPDFDAEKRRRWYAASIGAAGASALIAALIFRVLVEEKVDATADPWWNVVAIIFGIWLLFFVLKYVAAYALWFRPYSSRRRAVILSLCAVMAVYVALFGSGVLFGALKGMTFNFARSIKNFWEFHVTIYGLPYLAAALVGCRFARPAPDARESF